jgi:hypothetical protein
MKNPNILISVIVYNEEENINSVVDDILSFPNLDLIVIDNGSFDNTVNILKEKKINYITHCVNSGNSAGTLMTYMKYGFLNNYDIICQFDGDGQHIAKELYKIIDPIKNNEADYVIGSRFLDKIGFQSSFFRRIAIKIFANIDSLIIGHKVTDVTSGFRAYGKKVIELFGNYYKHEIYDTNQLLLLSYFAGARICEVPVKMRERVHGKSEFNILNSVTFPFKGLVNILGTLLFNKQIKKFNI